MFTHLKIKQVLFREDIPLSTSHYRYFHKQIWLWRLSPLWAFPANSYDFNPLFWKPVMLAEKRQNLPAEKGFSIFSFLFLFCYAPFLLYTNFILKTTHTLMCGSRLRNLLLSSILPLLSLPLSLHPLPTSNFFQLFAILPQSVTFLTYTPSNRGASTY